jgi:hypothetical protein
MMARQRLQHRRKREQQGQTTSIELHGTQITLATKGILRRRTRDKIRRPPRFQITLLYLVTSFQMVTVALVGIH